MPRPDEVTPRYRFHGKHAPKPEDRTPIVNEAPEPEVVDGVAKMRLYDPIDSWGEMWGVSAKEFADTLDSLPDDTAEIRLHINSPGGEVFEGIAILNLLRNHPARVVAVVDGLAASAASFIACGADEVVMGRNSELMIHDAWGICIGNAADMRDLGGRLDHLSNNIASVYADKAGATVEEWRTAMLAETWYSADEAVAAGLADRVEAKASAPKDKFDLSGFNYAGRDAAPAPAALSVCACGPNGSSDMSEGAEHKDECPTPATGGLSYRAKARHRAIARKHNLQR